MLGPNGKMIPMPSIENPHADLELNEEELDEIYEVYAEKKFRC